MISLLARTAKRALVNMLDPVPQNPNAILYGWYEGMSVQLRPVIGGDGRIQSWIPDPDSIDRIEAAKAREAVASQPPSFPGQPPVYPQTQGGADGFNPSGINGL